jgi:DNA polymerase III epsilon subunit-like protein
MSYDPNLILVFDTETTGFSPEKDEIVQLSYILYDIRKQEVVYATSLGNDIVNIKCKIPKRTSDVHGITKDMTLDKRPIKAHIDEFISYCNRAGKFVGHNIQFDIKMICGQIEKIIKEYPETESMYREFLNRFQVVNNILPELAFCTMEESKGVCAKLLGTNKLKKQKLMEVHRLLFNQNVGGQLHNALVDISVTLRVYLKLTLDIDICESINTSNANKSGINSVTNIQTICELINPIAITDKVIDSVIDYSGEIITGYTVSTDNLEEERIMVETVAKQFVANATKQAITNITNKIKPIRESMCTNITVCKTIIKSGVRKGQECGRPQIANSEFCGYHKPKVNTKDSVRVSDSYTLENMNLDSELDIPIADVSKEKPQQSNYFGFTRKNSKIVPLGGKTKMQRKKRISKKNKRKHKTVKKRKL